MVFSEKAQWLYVLLFFVFCCRNNKTETSSSYTVIKIDNTKIEGVRDISEMIDTLSILKLQETAGNYMGEINNFYATPNHYIAFDWLNTHKINLFDSNGVFIKTIIKTGDGPLDALQLNDCWINDKGELEVYDFAQKKVFQYDSAFTLKNTIKSPQFNLFASLSSLPNSNKYVGYAAFNEYNQLYDGKPFHIAILDKELKVIRTDLFFDKRFQGINWLSYLEHFYPYKDTLRFIQAYDNFIYNVTEAGVEKRYQLLYQENGLPDNVMTIVDKHLEKFKDRDINPNVTAAYLKPYVRFDGTWLENDKFIYIHSRDGEGRYGNYFFTLIDKKTNKVFFNTRDICETRKYKLLLPPFQFYDAVRNEFISIANGWTMKNILYSGSVFQKKIDEDYEGLYLIKVRLK